MTRAHKRDDACRAIALVAPDLNGKLRTRNVPVEHFDPDDTPCFVDIIFAFGAADELIPRPDGFTGWWPSWDDGFGDLLTQPDLATRRPLGWRNGTDVVFADLRHANGEEVKIAPRQLLRRIHRDLAAAGLTVRVGSELEFFLADGAEGVAESELNDAYAFAPPARDRRALDDIAGRLLSSGIGVSSWYSEGGVRQYEIALTHSDPVTAADEALLARYAIGEVAAAHGLGASFRPKPGPGFGSGLHVHVSLYDDDGLNLLRPLATGDCDDVGGHALAGMLAVLHPGTAIFSPTPEGFLRLMPHTAAGTTATWALDNRSAGVRYLDRGDQARLEMRCAASDANPYLVIAAVLSGIEHGIRQRLIPPAACAGDIYECAPVATALPGDLTSAARMLQEDPILNQALGREFISHYAETRLWGAQFGSR